MNCVDPVFSYSTKSEQGSNPKCAGALTTRLISREVERDWLREQFSVTSGDRMKHPPAGGLPETHRIWPLTDSHSLYAGSGLATCLGCDVYRLSETNEQTEQNVRSGYVTRLLCRPLCQLSSSVVMYTFMRLAASTQL